MGLGALTPGIEEYPGPPGDKSTHGRKKAMGAIVAAYNDGALGEPARYAGGGRIRVNQR